MRKLLRWRPLLENLANSVNILQQPKGEVRSLTVQQPQKFLKATLATPHGPVLAVALTTGMRPSEYLVLKSQDIDWTRQTVSVVRSVWRLEERWCFCDTKRSRNRWPIKIDRWIVAPLRDLQTIATSHNSYPGPTIWSSTSRDGHHCVLCPPSQIPKSGVS